MGKRQKAKVDVKTQLIMCKCGALVNEVSSYFGIPLHRSGTAYRVCRAWSGL